MSNKRLDYIDIAKAYLIFLVIVGHILIVLNPTYSKMIFSAGESWITTFHMPAFFVIHGMLFKKEKWDEKSFWEFLKKRSYSLIIPYAFFEGLGIICRFLFYHQSIGDGIYNMITVRCNVGADWFLIAMFMGCIGFWFVSNYFNHLLSIFIVLLSFSLPLLISGNQLSIVLNRGCIAFGFILVGYLGKHIFLDEKVKSLLWIILSFVITTVIAIINLRWCGNDIYAGWIQNPFTLYFGGTSGTLFILGISQRIKIKGSEIIGKHTLSIMGTHQLIIYALTTCYSEFYSGNLFMGSNMLCAIVILEVPIVYLLDQYLYFFVGKKRKS